MRITFEYTIRGKRFFVFEETPKNYNKGNERKMFQKLMDV